MPVKTQRIWELDYLRGIAIILMIIFHISWNLDHFRILNINMDSLQMTIFQKIIATLFLTIAGICLFISYNKNKESKKNYMKSFLMRGSKVLGLAYIISIATYFLIGSSYIRFGVLHLIGSSIILSILFIRFGKWNLLFGVIAIILGSIIDKIILNTSNYLIFGFKYPYFNSVDYFPIFPWFGLVLIGIGLGNIFYQKSKTRLNFRLPFINFMQYLGKKSLLIYFLHQPIIISIFYLAGFRL